MFLHAEQRRCYGKARVERRMQVTDSNKWSIVYCCTLDSVARTYREELSTTPLQHEMYRMFLLRYTVLPGFELSA